MLDCEANMMDAPEYIDQEENFRPNMPKSKAAEVVEPKNPHPPNRHRNVKMTKSQALDICIQANLWLGIEIEMKPRHEGYSIMVPIEIVEQWLPKVQPE